MSRYILFIFLVSFLTACASKTYRMPSGEKIPSGVDTIVLASNKPAKDFYKELKRRAVKMNYYFTETDRDTYLFVTNFEDVTDRASVQFKVYIKTVKGGSNAIYSGKYLDLKKAKRHDYTRPEEIEHPGSGKAGRHAWEAFHRFAIGAKKYKHTFVERQ